MSLKMTGTMKLGGSAGVADTITVEVTSYAGLDLSSVGNTNLVLDSPSSALSAALSISIVGTPTATTATYKITLTTPTDETDGLQIIGNHSITMTVASVTRDSSFNIEAADHRSLTPTITDFGDPIDLPEGLDIQNDSFMHRDNYQVTLYLHFQKKTGTASTNNAFYFKVSTNYMMPTTANNLHIYCCTNLGNGSAVVSVAGTTNLIYFSTSNIPPNYFECTLTTTWTTSAPF
ncbi:hypothetical protein FACS1894166_12480 [Bacilli bacterium]|nr:hypothetical protein FACS1894166_12480 [Bacilli bacterium]